MVFWCFKCKDNDDEDIHHLPRTRNTSINSGQRGRQLDVKAEDVVDGTQKSAEELQQECLDAHNKYRAQHNVPPLVLSKHLNEFATDWANHLANTNTLQHRKNNKYGENLYMATGMLPQIHQLAVKSWYDEIEEYDFNKPGFSPNTGHFTQVIWKSSKEMGMGVATKGRSTWIVCNYDPAGNVLGNFQDCVPPRNEDKVAKVIDKIKTQRKFSTRQKLSKECEEQNSKDLVAGAVAAPSDAVMEIGKTLNIWSKFELECLESHNKYRALHGSPVMRLNKKLCDLALSWSAHLAKNRVMSHRPNNQYGENIYYSMNFEPTAEQAVRSWYNEIENYNFSNPGFSSKTGHFTQVIWKDSVELGVGITIVANMTFVVCNYSPAGNVMGEYQQQVLPLKSKQSSLENSSKATSLAKQSPKSSFEEACLESHNSYRTVHGSPPLTLNKNLNFLAKDWAQVGTAHTYKYNVQHTKTATATATTTISTTKITN